MNAISTPEPTADESPSSDAIPAWRKGLSLAGCVVLGAVLLVAGWAKTLDPSAFADQIRAEGLDFLLPASAVALVALALEWGLGTALVLGIRRRFVLWPSTALVAFFVFLTGRAYWRHLQGIEPEEGASCGCFGNLVERTPTEAFWQDLLLLVPPLLLAWLAVETGRRLPKARLAAVSLVTIAMTTFSWLAPGLPLDDLATRLRPGVETANLCVGEGTERVCLDAILPEADLGEHLVVIADITAETFTERIPNMNEFAWSDDAPDLWVIASANEEQLFQLRFGHGPAFEIREAPPTLLRPLYRTLPRSFRVVDGRVTDTYSGLPPFDAIAGEDDSSRNDPSRTSSTDETGDA